MMFYNGFNLMIDIILVTIAAIWFTRVGYRSGFIAGHEEGERFASSWESLGRDTDVYPKPAEVYDWAEDETPSKYSMWDDSK